MKTIGFPQKALAVLLAILLILPAASGAAAAGGKDYAIINPYETVDWDTWKPFKANLHTHSTASDGTAHLDKMVEAHYAKGYDILAMTDHGVVNRGWNKKPQPVPIVSFFALVIEPQYMADERYAEITAGTDRGGRGMLDVPYGIELNALTIRLTHVNGFFADYGQGLLGRENDFETPIAGVDAAGGLTHINHPGYWLNSSDHPEMATDPKNIRFFGDILKKYKSCLGLEVVIENDRATLYDRVLWDGLLEYVIPYGRNVFGFANSDTHSISSIDTAFELFMMPENTVANLRTAMENGTFFACSRNARRELGDEFVSSGDCPSVTRVTVDNAGGRITLEGKDFTEIQWVADGEVIATGNTVDLNEYEGQIGCYVRAQLLGPGGICFTQAFILDDGGEPPVDPEVPILTQLWNKIVFWLTSTKIYVLFEKLADMLD